MHLRRVLKFGGAALADGPAVQRVCEIVAAADAPPPVVVVSAHKGVTDLLETVARAAATGSLEADRVRIRHRTLLAQLGLSSELLDRFWRELLGLLGQIRQSGRVTPAELDLAYSFGERLSTRIVAANLVRMGVDATPVDAWDLGLVTDSRHGRATPQAGIGGSIRAALDQIPGVAVVTGFLAKDAMGRLTTLGRNGSDLTASVLAEALGATEIQYWKNVGGILTADPQLVPDAAVLDRLTYAEAAELAFHGARVLHPAAVAPAVRARVAVTVRNVDDPEAPGTRFVPRLRRAGPVAVASKREVLGLSFRVEEPERRGERSAAFFAALDRHGLVPGIVDADGARVRAFVDPGPGVLALESELGAELQVERGLATLALVGSGVGRDRPLGLRALQLLSEAGVPVEHACLGARGRSQAFVVAQADLVPALRLLHGRLVRGPAPVGDQAG